MFTSIYPKYSLYMDTRPPDVIAFIRTYPLALLSKIKGALLTFGQDFLTPEFSGLATVLLLLSLLALVLPLNKRAKGIHILIAVSYTHLDVYKRQASGMPMSVFILTGFFRTLPKELEFAARIDGCSEFQVFYKVMLPLIRPALATVIPVSYTHLKDAWAFETLFGGVAPNFYGGNDFSDAVINGETTFKDARFVYSLGKMLELRPYMPKDFMGIGYTDMQMMFAQEMLSLIHISPMLLQTLFLKLQKL